MTAKYSVNSRYHTNRTAAITKEACILHKQNRKHTKPEALRVIAGMLQHGGLLTYQHCPLVKAGSYWRRLVYLGLNNFTFL